jgi:hypothetical protein
VNAFLSAELDRLEQIVIKTTAVDDLGKLESEVRDVYRQARDSMRAVSLIGTIIRKRLEWQAASDFFLSMAKQFPEVLSLQYDGALTAIDAGNYRSGQEVIGTISSRIESLGGRQLRGIWRAAPLVGLHDVAVRAFLLACERGIEPGSSRVEHRLKTAAANASSPAVRSVGAISIGENCLPWQLCQRWGLRSDDTMFDQESPFNLAQTTTNGVSQLFRDGLECLIDAALLSTATDTNGSLRPVNKTYYFDFNHERGPKFIENRYRLVVDRYKDRISKIRNFVENRPAVYVHFTERDGDLPSLVNSVKSFAKSNYRIVLLDSWHGKRPSMLSSEVVRYRRVSFPRPEYRWFTPDHYDSTEGVAFEQDIAEFVHDAMLDLAKSTAVFA